MRQYVYVVRCNDGTLYTGYTIDIRRRLEEHNGVVKSGAKYTRVRRPVTLVYQQYFYSRSKAQKREAEIKKMSKSEKEKLVQAKTITF